MPNRSLITAAVVVGAIAVLVAVFLGFPLLLTDEGVDVNAGLIISGGAAVGTVGTLVWAVFNGLGLKRQADADRRQAEANRRADQKRADDIQAAETTEKRLDQARRISGWATGLRHMPDTQRGPRPQAQQVNFSNSSSQPVYELVAWLVWVQGGGAPRTGEEMADRGDWTRMRAIVQVLPPGNFRLTLDGPTNTPMQGRLGLELDIPGS